MNDFISSNRSSCPSDYIMLNGTFFGTKTICKSGNDYEIGICDDD